MCRCIIIRKSASSSFEILPHQTLPPSSDWLCYEERSCIYPDLCFRFWGHWCCVQEFCVSRCLQTFLHNIQPLNMLICSGGCLYSSLHHTQLKRSKGCSLLGSMSRPGWFTQQLALIFTVICIPVVCVCDLMMYLRQQLIRESEPIWHWIRQNQSYLWFWSVWQLSEAGPTYLQTNRL